jgi:UDP-N-acetylglucosamine 2-epimerase
MRIILAETIKAGLAPTILFPNSDRGHTGVIRAIEEFVDTPSGKSATVCHSLERAYYLSQLIDADLLIGNSSSGIIEAATAGTAVVNVGDRQQGRERAGRSVINAKENASAIRRAIAQALRSRPRMGVHTVYGDGKTGPRIASELARLRLDENVRRKQCVY